MTDRTVRVRTWVTPRELPAYLAERARRAERHRVGDLARNVKSLEARVRSLEDEHVPFDEIKALVLDYFTHVGPGSVAKVARTLGYGRGVVRQACEELLAAGEIGPRA